MGVIPPDDAASSHRTAEARGNRRNHADRTRGRTVAAAAAARRRRAHVRLGVGRVRRETAEHLGARRSQLEITLHYIKLNCITLHYMYMMRPRSTSAIRGYNCIALHYSTLHYAARIVVFGGDAQPPSGNARHVTLGCRRRLTLHCVALHYIALHCTTSPNITLRHLSERAVTADRDDGVDARERGRRERAQRRERLVGFVFFGSARFLVGFVHSSNARRSRERSRCYDRYMTVA